MGMLKVGDKLEVMIDNFLGTNEKKGTILTVIKPDGYDPTIPDRFQTNNLWQLKTCHIGTGLKLLTTSTTSINPATSNLVRFKVGDTTEWPNGSHWEIIRENAMLFEIKLVQLGNYQGYLNQKIGDIIWYTKANFSVAKLVVPQIHTLHQQHMELATYTKQETKTNNCCCGAWACKDSGHSTWCDLYKPMWKDG